MARLLSPATEEAAENAPVILVVEDNEDDFFLLSRALGQMGGAKIEWAKDGVEAKALLEKACLAGVLPACIILDLVMPRMDGFALLDFLRTQPLLAGIPANVMTTSINPTDMARAYRLGARAFMVKPSTYDALVQMSHHLRNQWARCENRPGGESATQ